MDPFMEHSKKPFMDPFMEHFWQIWLKKPIQTQRVVQKWQNSENHEKPVKTTDFSDFRQKPYPNPGAFRHFRQNHHWHHHWTPPIGHCWQDTTNPYPIPEGFVKKCQN